MGVLKKNHGYFIFDCSIICFAFDRADQLANAMEARGYDPSRKRTRYKVLKMQTIDYASMILSVFVLCACISIWVL